MIRIDEIYNNTFWPWIEKNRPGIRMFFCDPPGFTDPEHLFNHGRDDIPEFDYVLFHDQEPVYLDLHKPLFDEVKTRNKDLCGYYDEYQHWIETAHQATGHIVVSEHGEFVEQLTERYGWKSYYYFYHGWACQDWFRGYDRAFLIPRARDREPTRTFMSPNRIIGGRRDHRVLFLYHIFSQKLDNNWISAPWMCPYEKVDISTIAEKYCNIYPDIKQVFERAKLPKLFSGEHTQQMTSCWLSNFAEAQDSLVYVPTETVFFGRRLHITEKTYKAIALEMPFILIAPAGSLEYMRSYGFKTFDSILDESYDQETDDIKRIEMVVKQLKELDGLSLKEKQSIHRACLPMVEHNYNHFYYGGLTNILWKELTHMLNTLYV